MDVAVRFLHAGDLRLEQPPGGLAEVPDHLRASLLDAPRRAAEKVFEAALKHRVDFVALAGNVLDPRLAGPRNIVWLDEQFARLERQAIPVYWAGGPADNFERWLDAWHVGPGVHRFALDRVEHAIYRRSGEPLVEILGTSTRHSTALEAGHFAPITEAPYRVVVAHGELDAQAIQSHPIHYWALGGRHARQSLFTHPTTAHYCGTAQARGFAESGPRGCTLVEIDESGRARTTFLPTDAVRYCDSHVTVDEGTTGEQLFEILSERLLELLVDPFGPELLVRFTVEGSASLAARLSSGKAAAELLHKLRGLHGSKRPSAWVVAIDARTDGRLREELYDEETLLGEYLRSLRHYEQHADEQVHLTGYLAERHAAVNPIALLDEPAVRRQALADAASLGIELLSPAGGRR